MTESVARFWPKQTFQEKKNTVVLRLREDLTLPPGVARPGQDGAVAERCNLIIPAQQLELAHEECSKLSGLTAALQGIFKTTED